MGIKGQMSKVRYQKSGVKGNMPNLSEAPLYELMSDLHCIYAPENQRQQNCKEKWKQELDFIENRNQINIKF